MRLMLAVLWFFRLRKRRRMIGIDSETTHSRFRLKRKMRKRQITLIQSLLSCICPPRFRETWMRPHSLAWFDMVEELFTEEQWYSNFRVTKGTFTYILQEIQGYISRQDTLMRRAVTAERRLALTLYFLASTAEYRTIANLFGVSVSFVCNVIKQVCGAIYNRMSSAISFPSGENLKRVVQRYEEKWGFPMCAGAIDGTHIPILAPSERHTDYVNRKGYHSILMQAVVDHTHLFRDIVVGWPGSVHDARVLSNSTIFEKGNNNELFPNNFSKEICGLNIKPVLIGDPAYPLTSWLMKPYPENNTTPRKEKHFNHCLSSARMTVEDTFGRWKGRFPRFSKRVDMEVSSLVTVVAASCILHNICEVQNNEFLPLWQVNTEAAEELLEYGHDDVVRRDAADVRGALAEYLMSQ